MQILRAVFLCLVLSAFAPISLHAQTLTNNMFSPSQGGFAPADQSALRRTASGSPSLEGVPPASGASGTGFDSLNRKLKKAKPYPGTPKPKFAGPGNSPTVARTGRKITAPVSASVAGSATGQPARRRLKVDEDPFGQVGFHLRSFVPDRPVASVGETNVPRVGAAAPNKDCCVSPPPSGAVLPRPAVINEPGASAFLAKAAVEISGGYESNPVRLKHPLSSPFYKIAPELQIASDWSRHSLTADLRGSFTGYTKSFPPEIDCNCDPPVITPSPAPTNIDRPSFNGKINGRIDVNRDMRVNSELRLGVFTDNPGSPNIQLGLGKYPLATTVGTTIGVERDFNRFQVSVAGLADRTTYQESTLTDGSTSPNDDRNFNQTGLLSRFSYDWMPGLKPFVEVQGDHRAHDQAADRYGYLRDSNGGYIKGGSTFEFSRLLTGEAAIGTATRSYVDPRLNKITGLLTSASLIWTATGLTTVRFDATSSIGETTLAGISGSQSRDYSLTVDHAFRRWLIGTAKIGTGTTDYGFRSDRRYFIEGDIIYKMTRDYHIKAQVRHDWVESSDPNASTDNTIFMLGVRFQR